MNIPKEQIDQWCIEWASRPIQTQPLREYIAQQAIEWERERLAKLAGEPVAFIANGTRFKATLAAKGNVRLEGLPHDLAGHWFALVLADDDIHLDTQDQTLGAIVRAEDAERKKWAKYLLDNFGLEID